MFFSLFEEGKKEKYRCWRKFYAKFCQMVIKILTFFLPLTFWDKSIMTCTKFWSFSVPTFWIWQISCSNSLSLAQLCVFCMDDVWESASILSLFLFAFPLRQEAGVEVTGHLSPANSLNGSIFKWGEKKIGRKWKKYSPILLSRKKRDGGARLKISFPSSSRAHVVKFPPYISFWARRKYPFMPAVEPVGPRI